MMKYIKAVIFFLLSAYILTSCENDIDVNADWKDITVVYGLLDQGDSIHYLKITKAFLGPGNALSFSKIPDSSNYQGKLEVRIEGWEMITQYDSMRQQTIYFDTVTIDDKEKGDSIFYYPHQLVYKSDGTIILNSNYVYKLFIREPQTGKEIKGQTQMIQKMPEITQPNSGGKANFIPGKKNQVAFTSAKGGKRYQLVGRFHYQETQETVIAYKYVDWIIFENITTKSTDGGEALKYSYPGDVFYTVLGNKIPVVPNVTRAALRMEYIFNVAADDLNTYMEVTEPSYTIVQEKPPYTNIINGIGIFSSRHNNTKDYPIIQNGFTQATQDSLKTNPNTYLLGF